MLFPSQSRAPPHGPLVAYVTFIRLPFFFWKHKRTEDEIYVGRKGVVDRLWEIALPLNVTGKNVGVDVWIDCPIHAHQAPFRNPNQGQAREFSHFPAPRFTYSY